MYNLLGKEARFYGLQKQILVDGVPQNCLAFAFINDSWVCYLDADFNLYTLAGNGRASPHIKDKIKLHPLQVPGIDPGPYVYGHIKCGLVKYPGSYTNYFELCDGGWHVVTDSSGGEQLGYR